MYINLDVVMRLVQIGLVIAGIGVLITLAMFFKNLIGTLHALTGTLDLLQKDLAKLEGPLNTVDELSSTVSDIQTSAKRAANTAIDTFQASSSHLMRWIDSKTEIRPKENPDQPQPDFEPVKKTESAPTDQDTHSSDQNPAAPQEPAESAPAQSQPAPQDQAEEKSENVPPVPPAQKAEKSLQDLEQDLSEQITIIEKIAPEKEEEENGNK